MRLSDYALNTHSQFGEDGMIAEAMRRIGTESKVCVEFGAADGLECSNTAALWQDGWHGILVEADPDRFARLVSTTDRASVNLFHTHVTPTGPWSIDALLDARGIGSVDLMSIDVDGDDYAIWEAMEARPRLVVIEYNQSIPPHLSVRQGELGGCFGASAKTLCELATAKGYGLVGLTTANLFFVEAHDLYGFADFERSLDVLFDYSGLTYLVTDNQGRPAVVGTPPWGWNRESYLGETVGEIRRLPIDPAELFEAYDEQYGPGILVRSYDMNIVDERPEAQTRERMSAFLANLSRNLVGIDVSHVSDEERGLLDWIKPLAELHGYRFRMDPGLITLIRG